MAKTDKYLKSGLSSGQLKPKPTAALRPIGLELISQTRVFKGNDLDLMVAGGIGMNRNGIRILHGSGFNKFEKRTEESVTLRF
jgi:5-formyltetrahydrofolate cyclo-ligase